MPNPAFFFRNDRGEVVPVIDYSYVKKVLVVGAGVAGLQAARHLLSAGYKVQVLEASADIGGVWLQNYEGYGLQVPQDLYVFPDFPYPENIKPKMEYPTGKEVHTYIRAYATHFDLWKHIRLQCKMLQLRQDGDKCWLVLFHDLKQNKYFQFRVDYAIVSNGLYSHPHVPSYEGLDSYLGTQVHAKDFTQTSMVKGRNVLIVGSGKTALDCVTEVISSKLANSVIMLYRQAHWPIPRRVMGIKIRTLLFNRAITHTLPPYYTATRTSRTVSSAMKPFKRMWWWGLEQICKATFKLKGDALPHTKLPADLFYGGKILNNTYVKLVMNEGLTMMKGEIQCFTRNGVILLDGSFIAADCVIYCTGYSKTYDFLSGDIKAKLQIQKDGLYLYRQMIPPSVPNLCFLGAEVSTYNNILTHGIQALWLTKVLRGQIKLPDVTTMRADVRMQQMWRREVMPGQRQRSGVLMLYMQHYHDQLLSDIGHNPKRKGANVFREELAPYTAADYSSLFEQDIVSDGLKYRRAAASPRPPKAAAKAVVAVSMSGVKLEAEAAATSPILTWMQGHEGMGSLSGQLHSPPSLQPPDSPVLVDKPGGVESFQVADRPVAGPVESPSCGNRLAGLHDKGSRAKSFNDSSMDGIREKASKGSSHGSPLKVKIRALSPPPLSRFKGTPTGSPSTAAAGAAAVEMVGLPCSSSVLREAADACALSRMGAAAVRPPAA